MIKVFHIDDIPNIETNRTTKPVGRYNGKVLFKPIIQKKGETNGAKWTLFLTLVQFDDGHTCFSQISPHFLINNSKKALYCQLQVRTINVSGYIKNTVNIVSIATEGLKLDFPNYYLIDPELLGN